jgi:hypothetical protein
MPETRNLNTQNRGVPTNSGAELWGTSPSSAGISPHASGGLRDPQRVMTGSYFLWTMVMR